MGPRSFFLSSDRLRLIPIDKLENAKTSSGFDSRKVAVEKKQRVQTVIASRDLRLWSEAPAIHRAGLGHLQLSPTRSTGDNIERCEMQDGLAVVYKGYAMPLVLVYDVYQSATPQNNRSSSHET